MEIVEIDSLVLVSAKKIAVCDQAYSKKALSLNTFIKLSVYGPFFLRLFKTFRPPTVAVLDLKPCLFLLFLLLG